MSLIKLVSPEEAVGSTAEIYKQTEEMLGTIPLPVQMWAVSPAMLPPFMGAIGYLMQHKTLSPALQGWIRYLVSSKDKCNYCIDFNKAFLIEHCGANADDFDKIKQDPDQAPLDKKETAMLLFVLKAANNSNQVTADDISSIKNLGYSEQEIFEAVASAAIMAMDDILINTFKVE